MQALIRARHRAAAPLLLGLLLALAGCGGGGGGDPTAAGGASGAGPTLASASSETPGLASGSGVGGTPSGGATPPASTPTTPSGSTDSSTPPPGPAAEVRYTLGPVTVANTTTLDYQTLEGMSATEDGGYRVVWYTGSFDADMVLHLAYFEQRYDAAGQRVGGETPIDKPTEDLSGSRDARVEALGGGYLQFGLTDALRPGLLIQHFAADGTAVDAPVQLGGAAHGWSAARVALPNGAVAITWQPFSSVGPGELQTALMLPGPR